MESDSTDSHGDFKRTSVTLKKKAPAARYYQLLACQVFNYKLISKGLKMSSHSSWGLFKNLMTFSFL